MLPPSCRRRLWFHMDVIALAFGTLESYLHPPQCRCCGIGLVAVDPHTIIILSFAAAVAVFVGILIRTGIMVTIRTLGVHFVLAVSRIAVIAKIVKVQYSIVCTLPFRCHYGQVGSAL